MQEGFRLITGLLTSNQFCARCSGCHVLLYNPPDFRKPTFEYFCTEILLMDQVSKIPGIFKFFHICLVSIGFIVLSYLGCLSFSYKFLQKLKNMSNAQWNRFSTLLLKVLAKFVRINNIRIMSTRDR